ncbi:MFS-type transporter SLC18B1 [Halotydeus destructor]|nr:MFS-type transporter SLC18B1 [Halotydeus destructor]
MQPPIVQLLLLVLIAFSLTLTSSILGPLFPPEATSKGVSGSVSGFIFGAYPLLKVILSPVTGYLIPKTGIKLLLTYGFLLVSGSQILFGAIDVIDGTTLFTVSCFAIRLVMATGATLCQVSGYFRVAQLFSDRINFASAVSETCIGLSRTVGPLIGSYLFTIGGYQLPFYITGLVALATIPLIWFFMTEDQSSGILANHRAPNYRGILNDQLLLPFYGLIVVGINMSILEPILEPHTRELNLSTQQVGLLFTIFNCVYTGFALWIGNLTDGMTNTVPILITGQLGVCAAYLFLGPSPVTQIQHTFVSDIASMVLLGLFNAIAAIPVAGLLYRTILRLGFEQDMAFSVMATITVLAFTLGEFIGTSASGVLVEYVGFVTATQLFAFVNLVAAILYIASACRKIDTEAYYLLK